MRALAVFLGFSSLLVPGKVWADSGPKTEARETFDNLNALRVDPEAIYTVDTPNRISLNRGDVRLSFERGRIAFLKPYGGHITGLVFLGGGRVLALPRSVVERQQMARFAGAPLLDEEFTSALLRFTDNSADEMLHQMQAAKLSAESDQGLATRWDALLAASNPSQSLRVLFELLSQTPRPYFYARLEAPGNAPFDIVVDPLREESLMIGQGKKTGDRTYYDVWASYALPDFPEPKPAFRALHYGINATILPNDSLEGSTEVRLVAAAAGERMAIFQLSRMLNVDEVTGEQGEPLTYFQNEGLNPQERSTRGNDYVYVVLPALTQSGQQFTLRFRYRGNVIEDAGNGVLFVGAREDWYPHYGNTADFADYDLKMRWPRRFRLVATGAKVDERDDGDFHLAHWRTERPTSVAGFNLGEYASAAFPSGARSIELYANRQLEQALADRLAAGAAEIAPHLPPFLGPEGTTRSNVMIVPTPPSPADALKQLGREIDSSIRFYETFSGPFPFQKLSVSQIPGSFGQGWPGLLYLSTFSFLPAATQQRAGLSENSQELFTELVPFHEVAHQWWGNIVGWNSYRDQWIDEAIANYLALLFSDSQKTRGHSLHAWLTRYRQQLLEKPVGADHASAEIGSVDLGARLNSSKSPNGFEHVIYPKGSWVIHMIREMLRQPGTKNPDARFVALLHTLATKYAYRALSTADLQREVEAIMTPSMDLEGGRSMDWFFEQWVRGIGVPHYRVSFSVHREEKGYLIRGKLFQTGVPRSFIAPVPVYVSTGSTRASFGAIVIADGPETSFHFTTQAEPHNVLIDPQMTLLCTTN